MDKRFPKTGNYIEEFYWPQDENGYDKEAFRLKCFRSYIEYIDDEDPLFYFENADSILAPAFYAPRKEQEIDKPPKFIQVANFDEVISEDLMKEAFCLWDGNFEASEQEFFSPIFPRHMDSAMFNNGQVVKKRDLFARDITELSYDIKVTKWKKAQSHAKQTKLETYSKTFSVKDRDTNQEFERLQDKAMPQSELNKEAFDIQTKRRKMGMREALKKYDERAAYRHTVDFPYIKVSPDQAYEVEVDPEENCSFFQLVLNAFYFEEGHVLIYKENYGTIPLHQVRSLKDLKYRKKRGWGFLKPNFKFKSFIKNKYSIFIKSTVQDIKIAYVIFDFSYITSALKVLYIRIASAIKIFYGYELWVFIIKGIFWLAIESSLYKQKNKSMKMLIMRIKQTNKKIINTAKSIILKTLPPKTIRQKIKLKIISTKKLIKDKFFSRKKKR